MNGALTPAQTMTAWEGLGAPGRAWAAGIAFYLECDVLDADLLDFMVSEHGSAVRDAARWVAMADYDLMREVAIGHG
jgi:hypothetical protein